VKGDAYTCLYENDKSAALNIMQAMRKAGQEVPQELKEICDGSSATANLDGQWGGRYANNSGALSGADNWGNTWSNGADWGQGSGGGWDNHGGSAGGHGSSA